MEQIQPALTPELEMISSDGELLRRIAFGEQCLNEISQNLTEGKTNLLIQTLELEEQYRNVYEETSKLAAEADARDLAHTFNILEGAA